MIKTIPLLPAAAMAALLALSCAAPELQVHEVVQLVHEARYADAVTRAEELVAENPDDPLSRELHKQASVALLLERGRRASFAWNHEEALEHFRAAKEIDPENATVESWIEKELAELTIFWLDVAHDLANRDDLIGGLEAYEKALFYMPDALEGLRGASRMLLLMNYRQGVGEEYYREGVRAVYDYRLWTAASRFDYVTKKYIPGDEKAKLRGAQVRHEIASGRLEVARSFERDRLFAAAMYEYRLVLLLDPERTEAQDSHERMKLEVEALLVLSQADMLIRKKSLEEALVLLEANRGLTVLQKDEFSLLVNQIEEANWKGMYEGARTFEEDFLYVEAVELYGRLLAEAESYEDAIFRKRTLEDFVQHAEELYRALQETEDPREQLVILREIEVFWPEHQDVPERLAALAAELDDE
ncbi:MAG: hypothetical protein O7B99_01640 [Planctomycetota bacterium]|nr:hypothetical protein [Planctomycetota bacterium]